MRTSRNLRKSYRNPGTVEKRFSFITTFVTFAHNKCSEAKIRNDLQLEQRRDGLFILDFVPGEGVLWMCLGRGVPLGL